MNGVPFALPTNPVQFDEQSVVPPGAPEHGQHTEEVLMDAGIRVGNHREVQGVRSDPMSAATRAWPAIRSSSTRSPQDFFDGAYDTYRRLRDEAPVYYSAKWDFWALTRYDDVAPATKDHETYSSAKGATLDMVKAHDDAIPVPKVIISMDPPEHEKMRKLVSKVFTPRAIDALEDMVREKVYERIEALDPKSFDVVADFSALFPNEVITTMLGVPKEDRHQIRLWLDLLLERNPGQIATTAEGCEALDANRHLLLQPHSAAARRTAGRHDQSADRDRDRT